MGKRSDQQYRTRLAGTTAVPPVRVFELAQATALQAKGGGVKLVASGMLDSNRLHLEMRSTGMAYAMKGVNAAGKQGGITVVARSTPTGATDLLVHLDGGITSQTTVMLIPVTSKKMVGFEAYTSFLRMLHRALAAEDPTLQAAVRDDELVG